MKRISMIFILFSLMCASVLTSSCGVKKADAVEQQGKEYTSAYICPMHCEGSGSESAGTCPVCAMDYKKNDSHKSEENSN